MRETSEARNPRFDGIICFGGNDWWYHNRGHYDLQMMREFSRRVPALYVNSIGVRVPRIAEGRMFIRRVARKLRSLGRGLVRIEPNFAVWSPVVVPGKLGMALSQRTLPAQVRLAARRLGIERPLVWVTCPSAVEAVEALSPIGLVYERTDRWESFPDADCELILGYHRRLQARADVTLYCSTLLMDEEAPECRRASYVDHGVDFDVFAAGGAEPLDMRGLPRPRAGFVGAIDASTFDPSLFVKTARLLPDVQFVLVGSCTLPDRWVNLSNVVLLGQKRYEEVPAYMAACDVLLMPWNDSEWIQACNPIKLKEYLAAGRPVVSSAFHELRHYDGYVDIARGPEEFAVRIRQALADPREPEWYQTRVRGETWTAKAAQVLDHLAAQGVFPAL